MAVGVKLEELRSFERQSGGGKKSGDGEVLHRATLPVYIVCCGPQLRRHNGL